MISHHTWWRPELGCGYGIYPYMRGLEFGVGRKLEAPGGVQSRQPHLQHRDTVPSVFEKTEPRVRTLKRCVCVGLGTL